jgi:hypothetical protein
VTEETALPEHEWARMLDLAHKAGKRAAPRDDALAKDIASHLVLYYARDAAALPPPMAWNLLLWRARDQARKERRRREIETPHDPAKLPTPLRAAPERDTIRKWQREYLAWLTGQGPRPAWGLAEKTPDHGFDTTDQQIMQLIMAGWRQQRIASQLGISQQAVSKRLAEIRTSSRWEPLA